MSRLPNKLKKSIYAGKVMERKPDIFLSGILGLTMILSLINYCYLDLQIIVRHSLNLWDCLFRGEIFKFYQTGSQLPIGMTNPLNGEVPYDIWVYVPTAVWNLPVYIWEKITGLTFETNLPALIWARTGNMVPFVASLWAMWKLLQELGKDSVQRLWGCYLFSGSMFLLNGLFCLGQIDILNVFFMLMGVNAFIRKNRKKFLLWFALSITCKMFALFVFLPLLVFMEKRILFMIRDTIAAMSLTLLSKCLFFWDKMNTPTQFDERRFIRFLFERKLDLAEVSISLFVLAFAGLLIWCWYKKYDEEKYPYWAVWIAFAGYSCFFVAADTYPYWAVVFSPFLPILIMLYSEKGKILLWLETVAGASYFIFGLCNYGYAYAAEANTRWMLAGVLSNRQIKGIDPSKIYETLSPGAQQNIEALLLGIFAVSIISSLVITWPERSGKSMQLQTEWEIDRGSLYIRLGLNSFLTLLPLILYLAF